VIEGGQDAGAFFSFIGSLLLAYEPAKRLGRLNLEIQNGLIGVTLMYEVLDAGSLEPRAEGRPALRADEGRITLSDVCFAYPGRADVLEHFRKYPRYQTRINAILRAAMEHEKKVS